MKTCKFCGAELEETAGVCPECGKELEAAGEVTAPEAPAEEPKVEETQTEQSPVEEAPAGETKAEESEAKEPAAKPGIVLTPGKLAALICVFVALVAIIIGLIVSGRKTDPALSAPTEPASIPTETTVPPTVPADGNPDDVTCKGTYTAADDAVKAAADAVVARLGGVELTNEDMQVLYWSEVWQFLSQYGSYVSYFGMDPTQSLDTQTSSIVDGWTWQQVFLDNALRRWQECTALALEAEENGFQLNEEDQKSLDSTLEQLDSVAAQNGAGTGAQMLQSKMGAAATTDAYFRFQKSQYLGYGYFSDVYSGMTVDDAEVEAFFDEHAEDYAQKGLTKETSTVNVRHILIYPEGATSDTVRTEDFPEEAWAAGEKKAQEILDAWKSGEQTEDSFAALAQEHSGDPGSQANGGLYEGVTQGQMVEEFDAWCFDPARQVGDTGIVKTTFGYHIMYFSGSQTVWQDTARADLLGQKADQFVQGVVDRYPMEVEYGKILLANAVIS